jgi:uncharacterized protein YqfA (UPF0365 family)
MEFSMSGVPSLIVLVVGVILLLIVFGFLARYLRLWLQSYASSAGIGLFDLVAMSFKKVNPAVIVRSKSWPCRLVLEMTVE